MSSTTIDNKVVKMKFDNSNFEKNVKTTMSTLDKLKEKLNFSGATNSLENISKAADKVDMSGLNGSIDTVIAKFSSLDVIAATALSNVTTSVMNTASNLVSGVTSSIVSGGYQRAINLEQAQHMFEGLGLDVEEAMANANDAVTDTAYGLDEAAVACGQLAASGVELGEDMTNALTAIAGVASMTGSEYSDISSIFTTVAANGKLMSDQLLQLSSRGLNAAAAIANVLGITESEVREMVSNGEISFETFWKSMYLSYANAAKTANDTFTGALSNVKAALARIGAKFWTPFLSNAKDVLNALKPAINSISSALDPAFEIMESCMEWLNTTLCGYLDAFVDMDLSEAISQFKLTGIETENLSGAFTGLKSLLNILKKLFSAVGSSLGTLKPTFTVIVNGLIKMASNIGGLVTKLDDFLEESNLLNNVLVGMANKINDVVLKIVYWYLSGGKGLSGLINIFTELGASAVDSLGNILSSLTGLNITKYTDKISDAIRKFGDNIETFTSEFTSEIFPTLESVFSQLGEIISDCFNGGITSMSEFIERLGDIEIGTESVKDRINNLKKAIVGGLKKAITNIGNVVKQVGNLIGDIFTGKVTSITNFIDRLSNIQIGVNTLGELFEKLGNFITTVFGNATSVISGLFSSDTDSEGMVSEMTILGSAAEALSGALSGVSGIFDDFKSKLDGIVDNLSPIVDQFGDLISDFVGFINDNLGLIVSAGILVSVIWMLQKFAGMLSNAVSFATSIQSVFKAISSAIKEIGKAEALKLQSEALYNVAKSILVVAIAFKVLATIDADKIGGAVISLLAVAGSLILVMGIMTKLGGGLNSAINVTGIVAMCAGMWLIAQAMSTLAKLDCNWQDLASRMALMIGCIGVLFLGMNYLSKANPTSFTAMGLAMIEMCAALWILANAMQKVADLDIENFGAFILKLITILGSMAILSKISGSGSILESSGLLVTVLSLYLVIIAIEKIVAMDTNALIDGIGNIIYVFLTMAALFAISKIVGASAASSAAMIISVGASMLLIAAAMNLIAQVPSSQIPTVLATITGVMAIFAVLIVASAIAGQNAAKAGVMLLAASGALLIMAAVIAILGYMDEDAVKQGTKAIVALNGCLALLILVSGIASKVSSNLYKSLIGVSVALAVMAIVVLLLGSMEADKLVGAVAALGVLSACLSALIVAMGLAGKVDTSAIVSLVVIAAVVAAFAAILWQMSELEVDSALVNATALSELLLAMSAAMAIVSKVDSISPKCAAAAVAMLIVMALLGLVLKEMTELGIENAIVNATALSELLLAMSASCLILSKIKGTGATTGVLSLMELALAIVALCEVLGFIDEMTNGSLSNLVNGGLDILEDVFTGIGTCVGNLIGGFLEGATSTLPQIGDNLSGFMEKASTFFDGVKAIDGSTVSSVESLVGLVLALGASSFISALTEFLTGSSSIDVFASQMTSLGEGLANFAETTSGITNIDTVKNAAEALKLIADAASEIPNDGGLAGAIFGNNNLGDFINDIVKNDLAGSLVTIGDAGAGINKDGVKKVANCITLLAEAADEIPNSGGVLGDIMGDNEVGGFITEMVSSNVHRKLYALGSVGQSINEDGITAIANALVTLSEAANEIPNSGGVLGEIMGDNEVGGFVAEMSNNGTAAKLKAMSNIGMNIEQRGIANIRSALKYLADAAEEIPNTGGKFADWFGDNSIGAFVKDLNDNDIGGTLTSLSSSGESISTTNMKNIADGLNTMSDFGKELKTWYEGGDKITNFGKQLAAFGPSFNTFAGALTSVGDTEVITTVASVSKSMSEFGKDLKSWYSDGGNIKSFGSSLETFGTSFGSFAENVNTVNQSKLTTVVTKIKEIGEFAGTLGSIDTSVITSFGESLDKMGQNGFECFVSNFNTATAKNEVNTALRDWIASAVSGANSKKDALANALTLIATNALSKMSNKENNFKTQGQSYATNLKDGVTSKSNVLVTTFSTITTEILRKLSDKNSNFKSQGTSYVTNLKSGVSGTSVSSAFVNIVATAMVRVRSYNSQFQSAGNYLVTGLANGIANTKPTATKAATELAQAVLDAINKTLDIASPSKKAYQSGAYTGEGFVNALSDYTSIAYNTASDLAQSASSGLSNAISQISDCLNSDLDFNPTIRPLLDLSEVEAGASTLGSLLTSDYSLAFASDSANAIANSRAQNQNGSTIDDLLKAVEALNGTLANTSGNTYNVNGVTYDDGTNIANAVGALVRAARIGRRA